MDIQGAILHELAEAFEHLQAARYYIVATVAVLYFDWFLTLSLEIERFWKPRLTGPTVLFLINRYFPVMGFVVTMIAYFSDTFSSEVCERRIIPFIVAANVISQSIIAIILALRTYALYHQNHAILVLVSLAWAAATAIGAWGASCITHLELPPGVSGCLPHAPDDSKYQLAAAYAGSLTYDALIYFLTLWKSYSLRRTRSRLKLSGDTLLRLVVRDGSVYFVVLLGTNLLTILLICLAQPDLRVINITFNHIIPVTITSRLLLNLRKDVRKGHTTNVPDTSLSSESSDFLSVVLGNIGESFEDYSEGIFSSTAEGIKSWERGYDSQYAGEEIALQEIEVSQLRLGNTGGALVRTDV